jgi:hypothetical protein
MGDLITTAELKAYLNISESTHDTLFGVLISLVSEIVNKYIGCEQLQATYTNTKIDGNGRRILDLPYWPVTSIGTVTEDDETLTIDASDGDAWLNKELGYLEKAVGETWMNEPQIVIVASIAAGYAVASVPKPIKTVCYVEVGRRWKESIGRAWGESSRSQADGSAAFVEAGDLLKSSEKILERYKRPRI